jgi:hypothetical protein
MEIRIPYTFLNISYIRVNPAEYNGWQVQIKENGHWEDVPNGYFPNAKDAFELISFKLDI